MTRETKAGLVVSFSFLSLLGVVLFQKWEEGPAPSTASEDAEILALTDELKSNPAEVAATESTNEAVAAAEAVAPKESLVLEPIRNASDIRLVSVPTDTPAPAPSLGAMMPTLPTLPTPPASISPTDQPMSEPVASAPIMPSAPTMPATPTPLETPMPSQPSPASTSPTPGPVEAPPMRRPIRAWGNPPDAELPGANKSALEEANESAAPSSTARPKEEAKPTEAQPRSVGGLPPRPRFGRRAMPAVEPPPELPGFQKKLEKLEMPPPPPPLEVVDKNVRPSGGAARGMENPSAAPAGANGGVNLLRPVPSPKETAFPSPQRRQGPTDEPQMAQGPSPIMPERETDRPLPGSPSIAMPAAPSAPKVEAYDELMYHCKAGDTFQSVSAQFFHSEKFAKALLLFNRNHPRAAEGVGQEPPMLSPGQIVYVPPQRILEKLYASAIVDSVAPSVPPAPQQPAISPMPQSAPMPQPATASEPPQAQPQPNSKSAWVTPTGDKFYRVNPNGETFRDIAGQVLGNKDRWVEIYKLNLRFNPGYPLPGGTELRLPPDARVGD